MKKILYFVTIIFNMFGGICSFSLFFLGSSFILNYLPIIIASNIIFISSLTITAIEFNNKKLCIAKNMSKTETLKNFAISDYKNYFASQKYDFKI